MTRIFFTYFLLCCFLSSAAGQKMDNKSMKKIFKGLTNELEGESGSWQLIYGDRVLFVLTDEAHNRMRIFTPVIEEEYITNEIRQLMLEANFLTALDAKYSIYNGFIISIYNHSLKELNKAQVIDALNQVVNLANNFGSTWSSTTLTLDALTDQENQAEDDELRLNVKPRN